VTLTETPDQIVAIGDVHGTADLLETMLVGLDRIVPTWPIYFLGDIVDRGPDSRRAMDLVVSALDARPGSKLLLGNHDDWLLRFLEDRLTLDETLHWLAQGGGETLQSYGVEPGADISASRHHVLETRPAHLSLLAHASLLETAGGFAFVHAGVDPARPMDRQDRHDCLWIREPFLEHVGHLDHVVVHGHSPLKDGYPVVTENRISIDTAAVLNGALTAILIDLPDESLRFLRTGQTQDVGEVTPHRLDRGLGTVLDRWRLSEAPAKPL
jgi:serine/threonine protein phosphatase 1